MQADQPAADPGASLERARIIARETGLEYACIGNVPGHEGGSTWCPQSGKLIIGRRGFMVTAQHMKGGNCACCGKPIPGIWA